jgi:hypothetical protein
MTPGSAPEPPGSGDPGSRDVVEHGEEPASGRVPSWLRRAAVVAVAVLALVVVSRTGLLSAGGSAPGPPPRQLQGGQDQPAPRLVARLGDRLLVAKGSTPDLATSLPPGLPADAPLVAAPPDDSVAQGLDVGPLVGVVDGRLFRADPGKARFRWLAPADEVLAPALSQSDVAVRRGDTVQAVEVNAGGTTNADPFPGYAAGAGTPRGLLAALGTKALVLSHDVGDGTESLSLAWPAALVKAAVKPDIQQLGVFGPLLGLADDWVISLDPGCAAADSATGPATAVCHLRVISVTQDLVQANDVAPPPGWTFVQGPIAGQTHEALVSVERVTDGRRDGTRALARLVPGGDNALLVAGTERVVVAAGLADGTQGTVYLLARPLPGASTEGPEVLVWDPQHPAAARRTSQRWAFPRSAQLLCLCR